MSRYQFIEQVATTEPVQVLCRMLAVSAAGYYQWRSRAARPTATWEPAAAAAFSRHAQSATAPAACGQNYARKGTLSGAMPCAADYIAAAGGR